MTVPVGGSIVVTATAAEIGSVTAAAGTINKIATPTLGWQTVNNVAAATIGDAIETDAELRRRQTQSTMIPSLSVMEGIVGAVASLQLRHDARRFVLGSGDDGQGAVALAIQREILGERAGGEELQAGGGEGADCHGVGVDAVGEALVSHVKEGDQGAFLADLDDLGPLGVGQVGAGRVVAAGVQQHDGAGCGGIQVGEHAAKVDAALGRGLAALTAKGGAMIVTADHGNCEMMIDPVTGGPHTAHTTNPVPVILVGGPDGAHLRDGGKLADLAPTVLSLMGLPQPDEMTGRSLLLA